MIITTSPRMFEWLGDHGDDSRFRRACRCAPVDRTPVWLMRQAGRYMSGLPRAPHEVRDARHHPCAELACQVPCSPSMRFDLDAAIIFADIPPPLGGLGLKVGFRSRRGSHRVQPGAG